jgi:hypothetical protein
MGPISCMVCSNFMSIKELIKQFYTMSITSSFSTPTPPPNKIFMSTYIPVVLQWLLYVPVEELFSLNFVRYFCLFDHVFHSVSICYLSALSCLPVYLGCYFIIMHLF